MKYAELRERIRDLEAALRECADRLEALLPRAYDLDAQGDELPDQDQWDADTSILIHARVLLDPGPHASTTSAKPERTERSDADARQG